MFQAGPSGVNGDFWVLFQMQPKDAPIAYRDVTSLSVYI